MFLTLFDTLHGKNSTYSLYFMHIRGDVSWWTKQMIKKMKETKNVE